MAGHGNDQTIVFESGGRAFALELDRVECIIEKNVVTPVPNAPSVAEGAVFYRDKVLPVIKLPELLKMKYENNGSLMVVVRGEYGDFGLSSGRIYGIVPSDMLKMKPIPSEERENQYICGIGKFNEIEFSLLDFGNKVM